MWKAHRMAFIQNRAQKQFLDMHTNACKAIFLKLAMDVANNVYLYSD